MGGSYDAAMSRGKQQVPGSYSGTAVPHVGGPGLGSYTQPQNWANPAVSGRDLIVHRDVLRQVASEVVLMGEQLRRALTACSQAAGAVAAAVGSWHEAQQLARAVSKAHTGVTLFTGQLVQAQGDMARRLTVSADRYDSAEYEITSLIHAYTDPSATIIQNGGKDTPLQPGYGQNWTPQQRAAYYRTQRLENMPGNSGPTWTGTFPITEDAAFAQGSTAGYTWQQVQSLLAATDPGAVSAAGAAYGDLSLALTDVASRLSGRGQTLAANWGGSTAVTAVSQVQQLYQTAADLQANTWAAQQALAWYGPVLAAFRSSLPHPASAHPADVKVASQAAQQRMAALNSHIETTYYQLPPVVNKNLPPALAGTGGGPAGAGGTAAAGGGAGYAGAGYPGGTAGRYPGGAAGGHPGGALGGTTGGQPGGQSGGQSGGALPPAPGSPAQPVAGGVPAGTTRLAGLGAPGSPGPASGIPGSAPGAAGGPAAGGAGAAAPGGAGAAAPGTAGPGGFGAIPPVRGGGSPGAGVPRSPEESAADAPGESGSGGEPLPGEAGVVPAGAFGDPAPLSEPGGGLASAAGEPGLTGESVPGLTGESVPGVVAANGPGAEGLAATGDTGAGDAAGFRGTFPMTGAGAGSLGQEAGQGRQYWTAEDEGTWGPDVMPSGAAGADGGAADAALGLMMPGGAGGEESERARLAWLGEDDDFWGNGEPAVPPVIGR